MNRPIYRERKTVDNGDWLKYRHYWNTQILKCYLENGFSEYWSRVSVRVPPLAREDTFFSLRVWAEHCSYAIFRNVGYRFLGVRSCYTVYSLLTTYSSASIQYSNTHPLGLKYRMWTSHSTVDMKQDIGSIPVDADKLGYSRAVNVVIGYSLYSLRSIVFHDPPCLSMSYKTESMKIIQEKRRPELTSTSQSPETAFNLEKCALRLITMNGAAKQLKFS